MGAPEYLGDAQQYKLHNHGMQQAALERDILHHGLSGYDGSVYYRYSGVRGIRRTDEGVQVLVRWTGWPQQYDSWVPICEVDDEAVQAFEKQLSDGDLHDEIEGEGENLSNSTGNECNKDTH